MGDKIINSFHKDYISNAYDFLGSHYTKEYTTFRVFAPHANYISVVGDFNNWNNKTNPMKKITSKGIWEVVVPNVNIYDKYKYYIESINNKILFKQDPYGYCNETDGKSSSIIYDINNYIWTDFYWFNKRENIDFNKQPINIYEVHLGSWKRNNLNEYYNYKEIAHKLIPYVKSMGYNYIELLPITEHPYYGSWGYQVTGYYSVTSRYGLPNDFMYLVDYAHNNGIGVLMDWVPAHFPKDSFGLFEFDGKCLYEYYNSKKREFKTWGTRMFNFSKPEIKSFLISSACFFLEKYHIDGLRVDAVSAMLYLDYDREKFVLNKNGDIFNLEAIEFLKSLNTEIRNKFKNKNIIMIAEESTAFPNITLDVNKGGLGFDYKWCMGWMNDTLEYMKTDPYFRSYIHNKMTFTSTYIFDEKYILPLSHDEVVHCKSSLIEKMPGDYDLKFSGLRLYYLYMMTHPGKKLSFMGNEFGQFIEWDENKQLDWFLLKYPKHKMFQYFIKKLNHFYLKNSILYEIDNNWDGFEWINADDCNNNVYVYTRKNYQGKLLYVILNFSGVSLIDYKINHHELNGIYKIIFNTNDSVYGGDGELQVKECTAKKGILNIDIPKMSGLILSKKYHNI